MEGVYESSKEKWCMEAEDKFAIEYISIAIIVETLNSDGMSTSQRSYAFRGSGREMYGSYHLYFLETTLASNFFSFFFFSKKEK